MDFPARTKQKETHPKPDEKNTPKSHQTITIQHEFGTCQALKESKPVVLGERLRWLKELGKDQPRFKQMLYT